MGALFGEQSMISKEAWTEMVSNGLDIKFAASISAMANIDFSLNQTNVEKETFRRETEERFTYSRGALPPVDGKSLTWAQTSIDEPNVLSITLERLDTLPIDEFVSAAVISNLRLALDEYCPALLEEGALKSCKKPPPDFPASKPRLWSRWSNDRVGDDYPVQVYKSLRFQVGSIQLIFSYRVFCCLCSILWIILNIQKKQYGLWSFQTGGTKLERFWHKNQHSQRKLLYFENWINGGLRSFQKSEF